jgi:DNA-binding GntR family transcriptional regulator
MKSIQVYEQLKDELIHGKWDFGEKILVNDLIEKFKVSRRPVMDALKMLENDGFVQIIPQSGCKVVDYEKKDVIDQLLLSSALESLAAELAVIHHTPEQIQLLEDFQNQSKQNMMKLVDKVAYFKYNRGFHYHILLMTHSPKIIKHAMQMWDLNDFYLLNLFEHSKFDVFESLEFHDQVMHAIRDKQVEKAKESMRKHFENYVNKLAERLPAQPLKRKQ